MNISVVDPIGLAFGRMGRMLFKPFSFRKWLTLGFCAWLAVLGEGGASFNFNFPGPRGAGGGPGGGGGPTANQVWQWILANLYWIVPVAVGLVAVWVAIVWVRSRGKLMFLDGVIQETLAVVEPWKRLRRLGNSFFRFQLLLTLAMLLWWLLVGGVALLIAWPDIQSQQFGSSAIMAIVLGIVLGSLGVLAVMLVTVIAEDFVIPLMYLREQTVWPAWREFRTAIVPGNMGALVLFYLMRLVFSLGAGMVMLVGTCLTCCLAALPYVYAVVFLPVFVFMRLYSLYFLRQFGNEYNLLVDPVPVIGFPVVFPAGPLPPPLPPGDNP